MSDLRESGSIEQDADQILFIHRPEVYGITEDEDGNSTIGVTEVIFAKNRHGAEDTARLKFEGQYTRFEEWGDENEWNETQSNQAGATSTDYPKVSNNYDEPLLNSTDFFDSI